MPFTRSEPIYGGRGYRLYDDQGKSQDFAASPAVEDLVSRLNAMPKPEQLAYNGAGGNAPTDTTQPPAPPPTAQDFGPPPGSGGPAMSVAPEPVSRTPPPEPVPQQAPVQPRQLPGRPPAPQAQGDQGGGVNLDPNQIPRSPMTPEERELQAIEDYRFRQAMNTPASPVRRLPATWQPSSRSFEERARPEGDLEELRAAQRAAAETAGTIEEEKAKAEEQQRALEAQRTAKDNEFQARQDVATRKFQEETAKIEADLEGERKALKDPNDFWGSKTEAQRVRLGIATALGIIGGALGGNPDAGASIIKDSMDRHIARRRGNIEQLIAKRGRGKEDFDLQNAALTAERGTAMRAIDEQVKAAISQGQNPILRKLMEEDVPITPEAVLDSLAKGSGSDVQKDTAQKRLLFDFGPNGELIPKIETRYLIAEHAKNMARLQAARENLGYAKEYATVQSRQERYIPERMTGGGGGPGAALKLREQQLKDRIVRGEKVTEQDYKAAGILAPLAGQQAKASQERAEKEGARTFILPGAGAGSGREYVARPGTSEKEMQDLRSITGDIRGMEEAIKILDEEASAKNKFVDNPRVEMAAKTFAGLSGTSVFNSGIVNPGELTSVVKTANNIGALGPSGVKALKDVVAVAKMRYAEKARQMGAVPAGKRLWPSSSPTVPRLHQSRSSSRIPREILTPSMRARLAIICAVAGTPSPQATSKRTSLGRYPSLIPRGTRRSSRQKRHRPAFSHSRLKVDARRTCSRPRKSSATAVLSKALAPCL